MQAMQAPDANQEALSEMLQWSDRYMTGCLERKEETFRMMLRSMKRTTKEADAAKLKAETLVLIRDLYLMTALVAPNEQNRRFNGDKVRRLGKDLMDEGKAEFARRLKALIEDVLKEA